MGLNIRTIDSLAQRIATLAKLEQKASVLFTKPQVLSSIKPSQLKLAPLTEDFIQFSKEIASKDIAYHGSPYSFDFFDINKIGTGEGFRKRGVGIYLHRKINYAPYFANIKSADAPLHLGCGGKLKNPNPHVYTISSLNKLNLKKVSEREAKAIAQNQKAFESENPFIHGLELSSGEICIFPKAIKKLNIANKQPLESFVRENKDYPFRTWTTDQEKLARFTS